MLIKRLPSTLLMLAGLLAGILEPATAQTRRTAYPEHRYGFRCAADSMQQEEWLRNPGAELEYRSFLQSVAAMPPTEQARLLAQPDVTIPVVVHIIHTGTANNISDRQVDDAIRILNEDFSKTNRDTLDVIPAFQPLYANVGFRFRLAKLAPDGNCTTGITRTYSTLTSSAGNNVKDLVRWDPNRYLNIWVVDNIASGAGGYAYLPCGGPSIDGIVIRNSQFASIERSCGSNFCNRSLTHEVGHHFGLPHTWGNSNTPGDPANCNLDDGIADTPNTSGVSNQGCNLNYAPCGVLTNVQNYMDYSSCAKMFTLGQKAVMRASLTRTCRSRMVSASNLVATGTNDGYQAVPCAPVAAFQANRPNLCEGGSVTFTDYSYNYASGTSVQYDWRFPGGQPSTSTVRNPTVTYPTAGTYDVTLIVISAAGRDTLTRTQLVQVQGANSGERAPLYESFETPTFPANVPGSPIRNWRISSSQPGEQSLSWERETNGVASNGTAFLQVRNNVLADATVSTLISPNINLSTGTGTTTLLFDRAYARRTATINDQLRVAYSTDCGVTWLPLISYDAAALNTKGSAFLFGFVPTAVSDWQSASIPVPAAAQRSPRFLLRFEAVGNAGNPIYLDNIRLADPLGTQDPEMARNGISVYPNPLTAETAVHFTLTRSESVAVQLTDLLGREVARTAARTFGAGAQALTLPGKALPAGVYLVRLTIGEQTFTTKVVVQ